MNKILLTLIILTTFCSFSQEKVKNYYDYNGIKFLTSEGFLDKKKKKTKKWIHYYKDFTDTTKTEKTQIKTITSFKNGLKNGPYKSFYPTGELQSEGNYLNDKKNDVWKYYFLSNKLKTITTFKNGEFESFKKYNENQTLDEHIVYNLKNDETIIKKYFSNEKIYSISIKKQDSLDYKMFNNKGELKEEGSRYKNLYNGERKRFSNGRLIQLNNYENGKLTGLYEYYNSEGNISVRGHYKNDNKHGEWKHYDNKNKLKELSNYDNGVLNGFYEKYNFKGIIEKKGNYKNGEKDGMWRFYNLYGSERSLIIYKDGKEISSESVIRN